MAESCRPASLPPGPGPPGGCSSRGEQICPLCSASGDRSDGAARPSRPFHRASACPRCASHTSPAAGPFPSTAVRCGRAKPPEHPRRQMARAGGDLAHQPERPSSAEQGGRRGPSRLEDSQRRGCGGRGLQTLFLSSRRVRTRHPGARVLEEGGLSLAATGPVRPTGPGAGARAGVSLWGHWDYFRGCLE